VFGEVALVTVSVDNADFVSLLTKQRVLRDRFEVELVNEDSAEDNPSLARPSSTSDGGYSVDYDSFEQALAGRPWWKVVANRLGFCLGLPELHLELLKKQAAISAAVEGHATRPFIATRVFVTFETEQGQRYALDALAVGTWQAVTDRRAEKLLSFRSLRRGEQRALCDSLGRHRRFHRLEVRSANSHVHSRGGAHRYSCTGVTDSAR